MNNPELFQPRWNAGRLALCNLLALALFCFWLWPPGHTLCTQFDEWLFRSLNHPLGENALWLGIWTVASVRPFDAVMGVIMLTLLIRGDWVFKAIQVRAAILGFLVILAVLLVIRGLFEKIVPALGLQHNSPSMVLDGALQLSDFFPNIEKFWQLKDRSSQSFPGDHASVLLIWALYMTAFSRTMGQRLIIWILALSFMMPRLVAGAHWGQDDYIGGVAMALLAMGWGYYTPLAAKVTVPLLRLTAPLFSPLSHLPLIRRLSVVRYNPVVRHR